MAGAEQALLRVQDVAVHFGGIVALDGVSFVVPQGRIVGLIGPNGAGKTTLFNCISRLYPCERGDIAFAGRSLLRVPRHRIAALGIGRTFQNLALFRTMSVLENVMVGRHSRSRGVRQAQRRGEEAAARAAVAADHYVLEHAHAAEQGEVLERASDAEARDRARELLALLELERVADTPVAALPFGTQKRVELARALAAEPKLLLLDEPASGLNHEEVGAIGVLIRSLRQRLKLTVLLVEHHMQLLMSLSDWVVALNFGKRIAEGTPAEVRSHPELVRAYLGST